MKEASGVMRADEKILQTLPLFKGAIVVVVGDFAYTTSRRLAALIQKVRPKLRVFVRTPHHNTALDERRGVTFLTASLNHDLNQNFLDRDRISGVINAPDGDTFTYTDASTAEVTKFKLPTLPKAVDALLKTFCSARETTK
jgi:hypothetical protein